MKTLYILNNPHAYQQCLSIMSEHDALLLIEDAVIKAEHVNIERGYVLEEDLVARGLNTKTQLTLVDYPAFVALTLEYDKAVSWL